MQPQELAMATCGQYHQWPAEGGTGHKLAGSCPSALHFPSEALLQSPASWVQCLTHLPAGWGSLRCPSETGGSLPPSSQAPKFRVFLHSASPLSSCHANQSKSLNSCPRARSPSTSESRQLTPQRWDWKASFASSLSLQAH